MSVPHPLIRLADWIATATPLMPIRAITSDLIDLRPANKTTGRENALHPKHGRHVALKSMCAALANQVHRHWIDPRREIRAFM